MSHLTDAGISWSVAIVLLSLTALALMLRHAQLVGLIPMLPSFTVPRALLLVCMAAVLVSTLAGAQRQTRSNDDSVAVASQKISDVERRVGKIEDMKLDVKIAALETSLQNSAEILKAVAIAIFLLVIEALFRVIGIVKGKLVA
jgi:hypothetical protein